MQEVPERPNVELRTLASGEEAVVFAFPYRTDLVDALRAVPGRRFDWDRREWLVPRTDAGAVYTADLLARWPALSAAPEVRAWLDTVPARWIGRTTAVRHAGRGRFVARTLAGELPPALAEAAEPLGPRETALPFAPPVAEALLDLPGSRLDDGAAACAERVRLGLEPPGATLVVEASVGEPRFALRRLWDGDAAAAFAALPAIDPATGTLPVDPWALEPLEGFLGAHAVEVAASAERVIARLEAERSAAQAAIRRSRAREAPPLDPPPRLGGELAPFQWAGVLYALDARRTFLADEQGLGKTVQALAALEADGAFPAVVVCPASLKLNWEREAARWLPQRTRAVVTGRDTATPSADLVILNYEIVAAHVPRLALARPRALVVDESHLVKNPRAKRTQAVRRLAAGV